MSDHPPWLRSLLADVSNADMAAYAADIVACQASPTELEAKLHKACAGLSAHAESKLQPKRAKPQ